MGKGMVEKGSILALVVERFGDISKTGMYHVNANFYPDDMIHTWLSIYPEQEGRLAFNYDQFVEYLCKRGWLSPLDFDIWCLGDTGMELSENKYEYHQDYDDKRTYFDYRGIE
jgi:hypothetical protein